MLTTVTFRNAATIAIALAAGTACGAPADPPAERVNLGLGTKLCEGAFPAVAVNDSGTAVMVYREEGAGGKLLCRVGTATAFGVEWGAPSEYGKGYWPTVAINASGKVVAVNPAPQGSKLQYRAGAVVSGAIAWGGPTVEYDDGVYPAIAINSEGRVVEVHTSQNHPTLWARTGTYTGGATIAWDSASKEYDKGGSLRVALNDSGQVVDVHVSQNDEQALWYRVGSLKSDHVAWGESHQYGRGIEPAIALANDGTAIEVHATSSANAGEEPPIWQRTGRVAADGTIAWSGDTELDTGWTPSVGCNSKQLAVGAHSGRVRGGVYASTSLVVDRSRWMEDSPGMASKHLWEVTLPGTHDSGTFALTTVHCPCGDSPEVLPGSISKPRAEAQSDDLGGQLRGGVRYFDLRPYNAGLDTYLTYHDVNGSNIGPMLDQVRDFL